MAWSQKIWPANPPASWVPDSTARAYDLSGNVVHGYRWVGKRRGDGTITLGQEEETRSWYSADDRLVAMQKYGVRNTGEDEVSGVMYYEHAGVWEEYRYDAYADGPNVGRVSDCGSFPAQNCVPIQWPGERTTVYHELTPDRNIEGWFGSLVDDIPASHSRAFPPRSTTSCRRTADAWNWFGSLADGMLPPTDKPYRRNRSTGSKSARIAPFAKRSILVTSKTLEERAPVM